MIANYFIFGAWRSADSAAYPQSDAFVDAARLPSFEGTRIHFGLVLGLLALVVYWFLISKTRWGLEMRSIGGNPEAARRVGISLSRYIIITLFIAGGIAGLAGMAEVSAVEGRLKQNLSPGYGFSGFLISWLAGGNPIGILVMAFLLSMIRSGGDILQITQGVPFAVINILLALILFVVLARPERRRVLT
jgi:simple sugar transport system permease protein